MITGFRYIRNVRSILLLILVTGVPMLTQAQVHLEQAGISVSLPNKYWKIYEEKETENNYLCIFKRTAISDSLGNQITPNIAIVSEHLNPGVDVVDYSIKLRSRTGYKVTQSLNKEDMNCPHLNMVGYKGTYTDRKGLTHTLYILYIIKNDIGIQVILDTTSDLFSQCDKEFRKFIKSIH